MKRYRIKWMLRAQPETERCRALPAHEVEFILDEPEYRLFEKLRRKLLALEGQGRPDEAMALHNEMQVIAELKVFGDASEQVREAGPPTNSLLAMNALTSRGFRIPESVREAAAFGQTTLLDQPAPGLTSHAHARTDDPWTSHAAAHSLTAETLRDTQTAVLACFKQYGPMHHEQLWVAYQDACVREGWPNQSISGLRTRTRELVDAGLVRDSGETVVLLSNRKSIVWEAT